MTPPTEQDPLDPHYPPRQEHTFEYTVGASAEPYRLDVYLTLVIKNATRNKVQRAIDEGNVTVNGKSVKASYKVLPGDNIVCRIMRRPPITLVPENIPLNIVYEDDELIVVNKPAGMVVHPAHGNRVGTLVNALLYHFGQRDDVMIDEGGGDEDDESEIDEGALFDSDAVRPGIIHRLDKDTSGILVVGKNSVVSEHLSKQFALRTSKRTYNALVWGIVKENEGRIDAAIGRSPRDRKIFAVDEKGKHAVTNYRVLGRYDFLTHLELQLETGRTHQIRIHCASLHHALLGDSSYGGNSLVYGGIRGHQRSLAHKMLTIMNRQALHATTLGFTHPRTGEWMEFTSELPEDFATVLNLAKREHEKSLE